MKEFIIASVKTIVLLVCVIGVIMFQWCCIIEGMHHMFHPFGSVWGVLLGFVVLAYDVWSVVFIMVKLKLVEKMQKI